MTTNFARVVASVDLPAKARLLLVTPLLLLALAASVHAESLFLAPFLSFDTRLTAGSVAIADLNADGRPDLVTANVGYNGADNTVAVLLGSGDGTFSPRTEYDTGPGLTCDLRFCSVFPVSVAIADLNGDGKPDLAVPNLTSSKVSVLLGNGDGTFGPRTDFATGSSPSSVAIADLNADGWPDLVVTNKGSSSVSVLLGIGNGTFGAMSDFATGTGPASVAIADLDADGLADVAVACNASGLSNIVSVLLGNGDGTFRAKRDFGAAHGALSLAIADLNADGVPDLAVASGDLGGHDPHDPTIYPPSSVFIMLGNGDGTFDELSYTLGGGISVAIADLNADGRPDMVLGGGVAVALGNGDGTFGSQANFPSGGGSCVAIHDLNGDGRLDVAVAGGSSVSVLLGHGNGRLGNAIGLGIVPRALAIADLNADGRLDLAAANGVGVSVLLGIGDGTVGPASTIATGDVSWDVAVADLNADGRPDLAVANLYGQTVSVLLGYGDGTFGPKTDYSGSSGVAIADLNADGKPDLVTATNSTTAGIISAFLGNGDGTFGPEADFVAGISPMSVAVADLNADGRPDAVVANYGSNTVSVLLGNGDGTFGPKTDFGTGFSPTFVAIGDLNGDGRPDLAVANYSSSTLSVLLGNGNGTFGNRTDFGTGSQPQCVAIHDLDEDGRPDVAVANRYSNTVSVLISHGDGTFAPRLDFGTGLQQGALAIGDLDGDGRPDLVSGSAVLIHAGDNSTATLEAQFDATSGPDGIALRWSFGDVSRVSSAVVERSAAAAGPWAPVTAELRRDGDAMVVIDRTADPGRTYFYRLDVKLVDGSTMTFGPISSTASGVVGESAVNLLGSNPAHGASQVQYSVARAGHVRLEVADVAGRVVTTLFDGVQQPGRFRLAWDGTSRGERLPAGLYFLRLRAPDRTVARKISRLQ